MAVELNIVNHLHAGERARIHSPFTLAQGSKFKNIPDNIDVDFDIDVIECYASKVDFDHKIQNKKQKERDSDATWGYWENTSNTSPVMTWD